ncbi:piggyBac transposable element-derived protein 4-like [Liolophura sinensis]|uniref:piggyBac transposable element-derived protein 4-like n=1 Tax=Liolophura sinensis TaxID=3198878 RepID=UPI00315916DB
MKVSNHGQPFDVCDRLLENHGGKHHHLVVDNYYTSLPLCEHMLDKQIYVTGTVRSNRVGLPDPIKKTLKHKGDMVCQRKGQILAVNWMDRKQVRLLSTISNAGTVEKENHNKVKKTVPNVVIDYNAGIGGVDKSDQMTDQYSCELRSRKCWRKIVFHLLDRTLTNAYILYKENSNIQGIPMTHLKFTISVVEGLIGGYEEPHRKVGMPSIGDPLARKSARHFISKIPDGKRRKCAVCAKSRQSGLGYQGSRIGTWCKDCGVGLCRNQCFEKYHK